MIPALIAAGATLAGGYLSSKSADNNAEKNIAMQKEFAQNGIRWKVEDAKKAGVHPLYAMGAQTSSFAPVQFGGGMGESLAQMGQDVGRSMNATSTANERATAYSTQAAKLQLDNMSLQNQLLASKVATMNQAGGNPPLPTAGDLPPVPEDKKQDPRPPLQMGGDRWATDPGTSNAQVFENRYGDDGPASWLAGVGVGWNDLKRNYGQPETWPLGLVKSVWSALSTDAKNEWGNLQNFTNGLRRKAIAAHAPRPLGRR